MRILIADDERLVQITLESMLRELYGGAFEICRAANGRQLTAALKEKTCDLVFLDINMPIQQGLDVMAEVKPQYPGTDWCILTGYGYFGYAKRALELGAKGYLLKPPDPEELKRFVDQILDERKERRKRERSLLAERIRRSLYLDEEPEGEEKTDYMVYAFFADAPEEAWHRAVVQRLYGELELFMQRREEQYGEVYALFFGTAGELCLLRSGGENMQMGAFLRKHMSGCEGAAVSGFSVRAGGLRAVKGAVQLAEALSSLRFYQKDLEITPAEAFDEEPEILKIQRFCFLLEQVLAEYFAQDAEALLGGMRRVREAAEVFRDEVPKTVRERTGRMLCCEFPEKGAEEFWKRLQGELVRRCRGADGQQNLVERIGSYVKQNYMDDVSIERMGELFSITPTYLSRIFREKTGSKYIDYVTAVRMEKAAELLEIQNYTVREVSAMVGYSSEKHFSRNFKKYFGRTPSQR